MAFSNEDVLAWFNSTTPIPAPKTEVTVLKGPGTARRELEAKLQEQLRLAEEEKQKQKQLEEAAKSQPAKKKKLTYFEKLQLLNQQDQLQPEHYPQLEDVDSDDDVGPARAFNPEAMPGDHDYDPQRGNFEQRFMTINWDHNTTPSLPIENHRRKITKTINNNPVTVIQGETGSGKSTQVAQYILEDHWKSGRYCNIVCTQPRRIAAVSISRYIAQCRNWELGDTVGYQIGMDKQVNENTVITFVTTGVLLQKMINMRSLNQYTHIILDEVHERDKDTDFCLLVVKKLLRTNSKSVKVVLMSATIEASMFAEYFATRVGIGRAVRLAPLVQVEGRTHPVLEYTLNDLGHLKIKVEPMDPDNPRISPSAMNLARLLIFSFQDSESRDIASRRGDFTPGTVLIFLPGMPEIREMQELLADSSKSREKWKLIPLHSTISSEEQNLVFQKPRPDYRKIILATNIAESSITVPDVKYVIDFCLVKQLMCDWDTKFVCLKTVLASRASLTQRKGRAGRVSQGRYYKLITREYLEKHVPEYSTPEMLRCPLESVVLKAKKLHFSEPQYLLGAALQPPKLADIESAVLNLKEAGALTILHDGTFDPYNGELTFFGDILESLPVDVQLGKLIVLGHVFGCLEDCIIIAAALSTKPMLVTSFRDPIPSYKSKREWAEHTDSDCIAFLRAYKEWTTKVFHHQRFEESWCRNNFISRRGVREVAEIVRELTRRLATRGIHLPSAGTRIMVDRDPEKDLILKLVICGAFYPHYFRWGQCDVELAEKGMSGHDPQTTVMVTALPKQADRYSDQICKMFESCGSGKALHFQGFRVYVEFQRPPSHSPLSWQVLDAVYVALKKRHERDRMSLYIDHRSEGVVARPVVRQISSLPTIQEVTPPRTGQFQVLITEHFDAGHFWVQFADKTTAEQLQLLNYSINFEKSLKPLSLNVHEMMNAFCLAPFSQDKLYYRAKIIKVIDEPKTETIRYVEVIFVDFGNIERVTIDSLCELQPAHAQLDSQAVECCLVGVRPAQSSAGHWSPEACDWFRESTVNKYLCIDVYSVVGKTLRVNLYDTTGEEDVFFNGLLVQNGFAERCEEPYQSKLANAKMMSSKTASLEGGQQAAATPYKMISERTVPWISPDKPVTRGYHKIQLKGPDSAYEVKFYSMTRVGAQKQTRIEKDSVNCFVIDQDPSDQQERLMVASHVSLSSAGNTCQARNTTLLPNVHGLIYLVSMLFAPYIELRTDELKRQYTGVICGLGFDQVTGEPLYAEHDMEMTFDTLITQEDIENINNLRVAINLAVGSEDSHHEVRHGHMLPKIQGRTRELLKQLILKQRDSVPPYGRVIQGWDNVSSEDLLTMKAVENIEDDLPPLFSLHTMVRISGERIDHQRSTEVLLLREKMEKLQLLASDSKEEAVIRCDLCNMVLGSGYELKRHLVSLKHTLAEESLYNDELQTD